MFRRALSLIISPAKSLPAVPSPDKIQRDLTARRLLALFDVPVSRPLPDSLFTETDNDTETRNNSR